MNSILFVTVTVASFAITALLGRCSSRSCTS